MYSDFDKTIKEEIIVLSYLQNIKGGHFDEFISSWDRKWEKKEKQKDKTEKEIEEEVEKEIYDEAEKLSKESLEKYYKIEKGKNNELKKIFKTFKSKVNFPNINYLDKGKFWSFSNNIFAILDNVTFTKLYEIKFNEGEIVESAIELDNNDLVFMIRSQEQDNNDDDYYYRGSQGISYLFIYKLKNENYILLQKIKEDKTGYKTQNSYSGCFGFEKSFQLNEIKKLKDNKIMTISNYGIRIYALNENKEYSMILMDVHSRGLQQIYEIDENNLIFCTLIHIGASLGGPDHDYLMIEKVKLKNITKGDKANKIKKLDKDEESKKLLSSLKLVKEILNYSTYEGSHYLSNFIILKQKYFIIMIDYNLLVFDLSTGEQMVRYKIVEKGEKNLYYDRIIEICKWNNVNDNEFFINIKGNITLFELDDNRGINLKIIAYSYFPNLKNLIKMEDQNRFYSKEKNHIIIY